MRSLRAVKCLNQHKKTGRGGGKGKGAAEGRKEERAVARVARVARVTRPKAREMFTVFHRRAFSFPAAAPPLSLPPPPTQQSQPSASI